MWPTVLLWSHSGMLLLNLLLFAGLQHREQVQDGGPQAPEKGAQVQENDSQVQGTGPEESGPKVKEEKVAQVQDDNPQVINTSGFILLVLADT